MLKWPDASEYPSYYDLSGVPEGDCLELLESELVATLELLAGFPPERETHRYAPDKWSVREVVGHLLDVERVYGYRALSFARGDRASLPEMDQVAWASASNASERPLAEVADELALARRANISMFRGFGDEEWDRRGKGGRLEFTVRSMPFILLAHEIHHRRILAEGYLVE